VNAIDELTLELARLPGVGRKTATRLTYHLLKRSPDEVLRLARALQGAVDRVRACSVCGNLTEQDPCDLCTSPRRDASFICVVEEASDIIAIERAGEFTGRYHVLGGRLSPLDGVGPDELNIATLLRRVQRPDSPSLDVDASGAPAVTEVIVATNSSVEGEATALYLQKLIQPLGVRVTRLARGLPAGGDLEYADDVTIAQAFAGRRDLQGP
jgi:recombination protein RecR